jgi:hypothetical protein
MEKDFGVKEGKKQKKKYIYIYIYIYIFRSTARGSRLELQGVWRWEGKKIFMRPLTHHQL